MKGQRLAFSTGESAEITDPLDESVENMLAVPVTAEASCDPFTESKERSNLRTEC